LSPALGIEIEEYESLGLGITDKEETAYSIRSVGQLGELYTAIRYADWIKPTSAEAIARYDLPYLKAYAAVTRNEFGKGIGWYVGTIVKEEDFYDKLTAKLLADASIEPLVKPPRGVEVGVRSNAERGLLLLMNHTDQEKTVAIPPGRNELLTGQRTAQNLTLGPFGVAVIELSPEDVSRGYDSN
jgi:beta-galactosidase